MMDYKVTLVYRGVSLAKIRDIVASIVELAEPDKMGIELVEEIPTVKVPDTDMGADLAECDVLKMEEVDTWWMDHQQTEPIKRQGEVDS